MGSAEIPERNGTDNNSDREIPPNTPADTKHESGGIGGKGGTGQGLRFGQPLISIKKDSEAKLSGLDMETQIFASSTRLGKDISDLLQNQGFETPGALLHVSDTDLSRAGFKVGHIAELRWALRKSRAKKYKKHKLAQPISTVRLRSCAVQP
ncbi:hypothetical protein B0H14DRAFT_2620044 [Mycena olivaceomarginata]|nr:hypothetical protein B0H14DRAFT_2620044 [Mycena olivaceomarginata]